MVQYYNYCIYHYYNFILVFAQMLIYDMRPKFKVPLLL